MVNDDALDPGNRAGLSKSKLPQDPWEAMQLMVGLTSNAARKIIETMPAGSLKAQQATEFLEAIDIVEKCRSEGDVNGACCAMFYVGLHAHEIGISAGRPKMSYELATSYDRRKNAGRATAKWTTDTAEKARAIFDDIRATGQNLSQRSLAIRIVAKLQSDYGIKLSESTVRLKIAGW